MQRCGQIFHALLSEGVNSIDQKQAATATESSPKYFHRPQRNRQVQLIFRMRNQAKEMEQKCVRAPCSVPQHLTDAHLQ
ncbi:hypothetical protein QQG55_13635 [Brugia pahangi]